MKENTRITVLGAGSWGTALAVLLARNHHDVQLWAYNADTANAIQTTRRNSRYLPDTVLPDNLIVTGNFESAVNFAQVVLLAVPSQAFSETLKQAVANITPNTSIIWATKGLDPETGLLLHQVVANSVFSQTPVAVVSGPSFAKEVAAGLPTAITIASPNSSHAEEMADLFRNPQFRVYTSKDVVGVQLGGAIKNILAIATGAADGLGFGTNTRAALMTRGLTEMMRFGIQLGGKKETFMGLTGLGDIILTCTDDQSRNRQLGLGIGRGFPIQDVVSDIAQEIEGIPTTKTVFHLAQQHAIDMPITEQVYKVLYEQASPKDAVNSLLSRLPKAETLE
ncbi:MAG: NAD(P)-dependent glycerol-3-phosphate dehydrogenase [Gammaproteobacteria bacterium]|nr:NAD(P)-dependent glycerol-3-phosphate dehydrogenase [Gammaproteobacteria bacterium]